MGATIIQHTIKATGRPKIAAKGKIETPISDTKGKATQDHPNTAEMFTARNHSFLEYALD